MVYAPVSKNEEEVFVTQINMQEFLCGNPKSIEPSDIGFQNRGKAMIDKFRVSVI